KDMNTDKNINLKKLKNETEGLSGADIYSMCRDAGMNEVREAIQNNLDTNKITKKHFKIAIKENKKNNSDKEELLAR
ncbi:MAG: hypothetical protein PHR26_03835, partial [Candidatus ainarchaeum sp.]|nr:hypothetical protein [Candidatus ainarchaeum sp.]